jgi:DNA polymerase III alpha subunit
MNTFTSFHTHSIYSSLDGLSRVKDIVNRAKETGAHGVCITDHAFATSHYELGELCEKEGIKPIFGVESYLSPGDNEIHSRIEGFKDYYHITIVAKNKTGYKNLMKVIADSFLKGKYRKARTSMDKLERWSEGLIIIQACLGGVISQMLLNDRDEEAEQWVNNFKEIFGENYYLELTWTGLEEQDIVNVKTIALAEKLGVKIIITGDSHYTKAEDTDFHRAMVCINVNQPFVPTGKEKDGDDVDESGMFYQPGQYWIKDRETLTREYYHKFEKHGEYFENSNLLADSIEWIKFDKEKKFPCEFSNPDLELKKRILAGLQEKIDSGILQKEHLDVYKDRIKEELDTIVKMGFSDYFIEIQSIVAWANKNGISTGPGRGCFYESTPVKVKGFGELKISEITPGMEVLSSDGWSKVISCMMYEVNEPLTCITYKSNNTWYKCFSTSDHKHLVVVKNSNPVKFYDRFSNLLSPDMIPFFLEASKIDGLSHSLVSYDPLGNSYSKKEITDVYETNNYECKVFDLMVEGNNTFTVCDHIVHNSGAGSFINFLLNITRVNPIEYGLLFSRMLNSGRSAYPLISDILEP